VAQIAPQVRFNNAASDTATLVDFVGEDRPGLLYDLASVFAGAECNIEIVLIDTEAHKAIDVFYVTHQGEKLKEAMQQQLQASLLRAAEAARAAL
jgi:[protein-PII] uridylyltransferase